MKPLVSITLALSAITYSCFAYSENPEYASSRLTIPAVDANGKPGFFQDVVIEPAGDNLWRVAELYEAVPISVIEQVEVVRTDSSPVQIFLKLSGTFRSGCGEVDQVSHTVNDKHFTVVAYYKLDKQPGQISCTQALVPFTYTIALPVFGLSAGEYQYTLNDSFSGSFVLNADNSL